MKNFLAKASATVTSVATATQLAAYNGMVYAQAKSGNTITKPRGFASNISAVINAVLGFVMVIAALLVLMYLVWGGIEWITSGGDKGKTESARNKITAAVIGLIILAASYAIFVLVLQFVGLTPDTILNFDPISGTN